MSTNLLPDRFYGNLSNVTRVSGITLRELAYPAKHIAPEHSHGHAYFSFTLSGNYSKVYGSKRIECTPQTVVFHPPLQKQCGKCDAGGRSFLIEINKTLLTQLQDYPLSTDRLAIFREGSLVNLATKLYREFREMDELSPLTIEGLGLEMLVESSRNRADSFHGKPPRWLRQAKEIADDCFLEHLTVVKLGSLVRVHPVYLATQFRKTYGSTVGEHIRKLRIAYACRALAGTNTPLVQIALDSGFSNQSHFSTSFKRTMGTTPAAYRTVFRHR